MGNVIYMKAPRRDDPLAPARGVINGLAIALVLWLIIGLVLWALFS